MATPDPGESFEAYVYARNAGLSRIAYLLTGDHHLAADLVQQTLLRVVGHWRRVAKAGDPDAYVRRILYNQHISWWRHRRHQVEIPGDVPHRPAALVLRYFEDLSESQTAEILGVSVGTVRSQHVKAWPAFEFSRLTWTP